MVDSLHRAWVGVDLFYCSDEPARRAFAGDPLRYASTLTDPVTLRRFVATPRSPHTRYQNRPYYFASDSTRRVFVSMPDSFAVRRGM